jgi:hypothetical protein
MVDALFSWYEKAKLPVYKPESPVMDIAMPASISGSILCHASCLNWHNVSKLKVYTKQRKERCGRLTADVAAFQEKNRPARKRQWSYLAGRAYYKFLLAYYRKRGKRKWPIDNRNLSAQYDFFGEYVF